MTLITKNLLKNKTKHLIFRWLPPAIISLFARLFKKSLRFKQSNLDWQGTLALCTGYNAEKILNKALESTFKVIRGEAAFERDTVTFNEIQYAWPVLSGLLWAAARNRGQLNVLDYGGSLGSSYFQYKRFIDILPNLNWNIIEQEHFVDAGNSFIQENNLRFYRSIQSCIEEQRVNVVLISSTLQYLETPEALLSEIATIKPDVLILDRTPVAQINENILTIQYVPVSIYEANYPMWIFSREKLLALLGTHWKIVTNNLSTDGYHQTDKGLIFSFEGQILEMRE